MADPKIVKKTQRVYQVVNLQDAFGVSFAHQRDLRERVGQALIDEMKERIGKGRDLNNDKMTGYSTRYKNSDEYIAARKDGTVNMALTGDMMGSMDILNSAANSVRIGFHGSFNNEKAYRHNAGDGVPERLFFGVTDREIDKVKSDFSRELGALERREIISTESSEGKLDTLENLRRQVVGRVLSVRRGRNIEILNRALTVQTFLSFEALRRALFSGDSEGGTDGSP